MLPPPKHSATGTTIFSVMSALAQQYNAINLSQGFPDYPMDPRLGALVNEGMQLNMNQYAPMAGLPLLRQAIAADFENRHGLKINADEEITITPGATYGIYTAFTSVLQPGDEVIVFEPNYDSYVPNIEMNGAVAIRISLSAPTFEIDWDQVQNAITKKTKAIIVNTPNNPTGAVFTMEDWNMLAAVLEGTDIYVLSDEVYEQLIYDGQKHKSVLHHEGLRNRAFALYSFGKVFHNTGWKMGFCIAPPAFTVAFRRLHQFLAFSVNTPMQYGLAKYLEEQPAEKVAVMMQRKRDYFLGLLNETPFKIHAPAAGSYFQVAGYEGISDLPGHAFAEWLTKEHGVATIPMDAFYSGERQDKLVRFCFAKKEETLLAAVEQLKKL